LRVARPEVRLCGGLPTAEQIAIQHGLYLGDVHAADRKIGEIVRTFRGAQANPDSPTSTSGPLVTIVLSDHGELFGEGQLMGHEFSLHGGLLDIPLIVHGLPGTDTGQTIGEPAGLEDLMPSILSWARMTPISELPGRPLQSAPPRPESPEGGTQSAAGRNTPRSLFSAYSDDYLSIPESWRDRAAQVDKDRIRQFCGALNPVFGGMASLLRYPFKYVWYERYPARLHDLRWDVREHSDVSAHHPAMVERFQRELEPLLKSANLKGSDPDPGDGVSEEVIDALKALGYVQ